MAYKEGQEIFIGFGVIAQTTVLATTHGGGLVYLMNAKSPSIGMWSTVEVHGTWTVGWHGGACVCLVLAYVDELSDINDLATSWSLDVQVDFGEGLDEWVKAALKVNKVYKAVSLLNMIYSGAHYAAPEEFRKECIALAKLIDGSFEVIPIPGGGKGLGASAGAVNFTIHTGTKLKAYPPVLRYSPGGTIHVNNCAFSAPLYVSLAEWDYGYIYHSSAPVGFHDVSYYSDNYRLKWYPREKRKVHGEAVECDAIVGALHAASCSRTNDDTESTMSKLGPGVVLNGKVAHTGDSMWGLSNFEDLPGEADGFLEILPAYHSSARQYIYDKEALEYAPAHNEVHLVGVRIPCSTGNKPKLGVRPYEIEPFGIWTIDSGTEMRIWRNYDRVYGLFDKGAGELRSTSVTKVLTESTDESVRVEYEWQDGEQRFGRGYFEITQAACTAAGTSILTGKYGYGTEEPKHDWGATIKSRSLHTLPVSDSILVDRNATFRSFAGAWSFIGKHSAESMRKTPWSICSGHRLVIQHNAEAGTVEGKIELYVQGQYLSLVTFEAQGRSTKSKNAADMIWNKTPNYFLHNELAIDWKSVDDFCGKVEALCPNEKNPYHRSQINYHYYIFGKLDKKGKGSATLLHTGGPLVLVWKPDGKNQYRAAYAH